MQVTFLCYSQTRVQSRDVKRLAGKAYLLSKGVEYEIREKVVLAQLKAGKEQVRNGIKVIKNHSFGMLEIAVPDSINTEEYIYILEKTGDFESVEFDTYSKPCMSVNDTYYNNQWGPRHIHADQAWEITTGLPSVKVAVIEINGFELNHPDLYYGDDTYANLSVSEFVDYEPNVPSPTTSHGTKVAGIIGAKTNNSVGIAGIAGGYGSEGSKIIPYRSRTASSDISAIYDAVAKGAKVINMSYSVAESDQYNQAINYAYNNGVTIVCASGNYSPELIYPASHESTIAVGAIDSLNYKATFSNSGSGLDLVAPGVGIWSTARSNDNYYGFDSGTSFAAPHITGVVALMLSINPNLTPDEIRSIMNGTAQKIKPNTYLYNNSGWNDSVGYGLVDAYAAVIAARDYSISGPSVVCTTPTASYTINYLPTNYTVSWSVNNNNFTVLSSGNQCFITYTGTPQYEVATLTATLSRNGTTIKTLTKQIVMHGASLNVTGWQYESDVTPDGIFPNRQFTIPANKGSMTIPDRFSMDDIFENESLPIEFIEDNTRGLVHPPIDLCGYGVTEINGGNAVYLNSTRFNGMNISFSGSNSPTYYNHNGNYVTFEMPYNSFDYPVTLHATSDAQCHDFCLTFNVVPLPGTPSGDDEIWVNLDGSMLYVTFFGTGGEPIGNGQYYLPNYSVTITKIPGGTQVYSNNFPGTQSSFSVNTSTWTSGIYSIRIVQGNNIYTKSICL